MALALLLSTKTAEQVCQQAVSARLLLLAKALATEANHQQNHANQAVLVVVLCVLFCRPALLVKLPWVWASGCEIDGTQDPHEQSLARSAAASVHRAAVAVTAATRRQTKTCFESCSATAPVMEAMAPQAAVVVVAAAAAQQLS